MSQVKIQGNASGTGIFTVASPNSNTDRTLTLPNAAGTMVIQDGSNNLLMNSGYGSDAVAYGCRAWVNFNGNGTIAIRGSANVSSITDGGVGVYTINFTTAMPDANYSAQLSSSIGGGAGGFNGTADTLSAGSFLFYAYAQNGAARDVTSAYVAVFR